MQKSAAAVLTPEAEQAAMQPAAPAPGGAPMDPAMMAAAPGGATADPAAMGAAPAATGPNGGQIPPEILQDQQFIQFLAQAMGIQLDQASGTFIGPDGQPIPAEMIVQAYQEFQMQMQQGGMGGAPMDPAMAGGAPMDPAAMSGAPADPAMQGGAPMDPAAMGMAPGGAPMDPAAMGAGDPAAMGMDPAAAGAAPADAAAAGSPDANMDMINEISSAVMSGIEAVLQDLVAGQEKKISAILDKVDMLKEEIASLRDTTDKRKQADEDAEKQLRDEISADLNPVVKQATAAPVPKPISMPATPKATRNLFSIISGVKA